MALPGWLDPLPDGPDQRALDAWAIGELGISGLDLMERAGAGLAALVMQRCATGRIAIVCGKGNNGGDGYVAARLLRRVGREVGVFSVAPRDELRGDALANYDRLTARPAALTDVRALSGAAAVVDAVLGTGATGAPRGAAAAAIEAINSAGALQVVACDIPSGVDASTGAAAGAAVRAHATATFHAAKPGLWIAPGKRLAGEVTTFRIGIPASGGPVSPRAGLIADRIGQEIPRRAAASSKFSAGNVVVCGGSTGLTGAPCLAARAAMRAGAGYVTACVPASLNEVFEMHLLEAMTAPLPDAGGALLPEAEGRVRVRLERAGVLVLGPGLGRDPRSAELARQLLHSADVPVVLDADGLGAHAGMIDAIADRDGVTVLTPHEGELARLLAVPSTEVRARRAELARAAASSANAVVVLKGDDTLVATPDGMLAISPGGAPALATAGTGDVLAGVTGAYLAAGMAPFAAACAAVAVHVQAGRIAAERIGAEGVIASDVIDALAAARARLDGLSRQPHAR